MINHGDYKQITEENKNGVTNGEEVCLVKIRDVQGLCSASKLPHGEYVQVPFGGGRPHQVPSSVNVLLWGGLSGFCQELLRKQSRQCWFIVVITMWIPILVVHVLLPLLGFGPSSDIYLWCSNLLMYLLLASSIIISRFAHYNFDKEMERIVSTKLGPVFRSYGQSELCYYCSRSFGSTYAYFSIKKLPASASNDEEQTVSNETLVTMDDDDDDDDTTFNHKNSNVPRSELFVPVFGTKYYNRGLEMSERPKDLNVNMFVWGMIVDCFQKVESSPRQRQTIKARGMFFFIFLMILFVALILLLNGEIELNEYFVMIIIFACLLYPVSWFFAMCIEPYPSAEELHQLYEHAFNEIAPIIEQNSMYRVEYILANNGRCGKLVFRLKQQQEDKLCPGSGIV